MSDEYDQLTRDALIDILRRRDAQTGYGLRWERSDISPDKALNSDFVGLKLDETLSCGDGPWSNLIVEGDNYDALRNLASTHAGEVRLIYIDPPYNTGRKDFVYNDSYFDATNQYRHSTWLEFMYQRLRLAKDLLADDGAIFVSIDDNELFNLGLLMNKVFGERNFIANVIWQKVYSPKNTAQHFSDDHEYVLVYARDRDQWKPNPLPRSEAQDKAYKNPDNDPRGPWKPGDLTARNSYSEGRYALTCPSGRYIAGPPAGRFWVVSQPKFEELNKDNRIWWGKDGNNIPAFKRFLSEVKQGVVPQTLWTYEEVGHTQDAKKQMNDILPKERNDDVFSTPKPLQLMDRILRLATKPGDLVVDFFAGSGTLAQALLRLNAEDNGDRRFILVSNTEATTAEPSKNLCRDVCAQRLRRTIQGYHSDKTGDVPGTGGNFAYLKAATLPIHRLEEQLEDAMVWCYVQMLHHHPMTAYKGPVSLSVGDKSVIAYAATTSSEAKQSLEALFSAHPDLIVYSWNPEALVTTVSEASLRPVPGELVKSFRFGEAAGRSAS